VEQVELVEVEIVVEPKVVVAQVKVEITAG
jgi:hypothetical protein